MRISSISDYREAARRKLPPFLFHYIDGGAYAEYTLGRNVSDLSEIALRQRILRNVAELSLETQVLGQTFAMPVALSPVGLTGMYARRGEVQAARAAAAKGVPFTLSTMSICSIEDVAEATQAPFWFQLYVMRDQDFLEAIIERARRANCSALVLTLDLQILGQRHKDLKNGLSAPPRLTLPVLMDMATKWRWGMGMLRTRRRFFGNIVGHAKGVADPSSLMSWTAEQFDPQLDWTKIARIRDLWGGKLILKGINDPEDARIAADFGADAIIVSNHGGRQLDGAASSIRMLPEIVEAVGDRIEVHLDSGIRSGQDVLKALAMGAHATHIGRAFIYGLGAMGEAGVTRALQIIRKELDITMALCGERDIRNVGRHNALVPAEWGHDYV